MAFRASQIIFGRRGAATMAARQRSMLIPGPDSGRSRRTRSRRPSPWLWMSKISPGLAAGMTTRRLASTVDVAMVGLSHQTELSANASAGGAAGCGCRPGGATGASRSFLGALTGKAIGARPPVVEAVLRPEIVLIRLRRSGCRCLLHGLASRRHRTPRRTEPADITASVSRRRQNPNHVSRCSAGPAPISSIFSASILRKDVSPSR